VRSRLRFKRADLLDRGTDFTGRFDVVCCHGVAMYLPSLEGTVEALIAAARPGGLVSLLTRNQAGMAMRAGMSKDWPGTLVAFDARRYTNRLEIDEVRADPPSDVQAAFNDIGSVVLAWYGVRLFSDHWDTAEQPSDFAGLLAAEEEAGRRDPYRSLAASPIPWQEDATATGSKAIGRSGFLKRDSLQDGRRWAESSNGGRRTAKAWHGTNVRGQPQQRCYTYVMGPSSLSRSVDLANSQPVPAATARPTMWNHRSHLWELAPTL
jgi:SAM-dependent methyltransferase